MAKIIGLPVYERIKFAGRIQIRCSAWGVFGYGDTRKEAFDNWKEVAKEQGPKEVKRAVSEEAAHGH